MPIFNEEAALPILVKRLDALLGELDAPAEAIFVDDGSSDTSAIFLEARAKSDPRFRFIKLSRNFGHQIAISAGMDAARGEAIVVMDADLQDPPEVVHEMIARWKDGFQIVYARRLSRGGESAFKRATANLFYRALARLSAVEIPRDVGDFRLIDRTVLEAFKQMPERDRFVRGMFAWLGFRQTAVDFHRPARIAGETKYPMWKMLRLALHGVVGFSDAPLRLAIWMGLTVSAVALLYGLYVIGLYLSHSRLVQGWTSTMVVVSFLCGANMLMTGIIGLYIGRIHAEVKRRPLYVIEKRAGFRDEDTLAEGKAAPGRASEAA
ncbi:MAG: glycosyltransferase family 2 protein [Beijerinckiaceae bacterium]